jgi:hypothetical protein
MLNIILIALAVAVTAFVAFVATRPGEFRISRSGTLPAPAAAVFPHVNDLRKWEAWSPWARLDPSAKSTFEGPAAGTGAIMSWIGNKNVGEGRMTIVESRPNELVRFKLEFFKPFKATNTAEFTFKPEGNQTAVTWSMFGTNNFMAKAINVFINCDEMVGGQFEQGLANLRAVVEGSRPRE